MDFSSGAGMQSNTDLIPNGQLCWVIIHYRGKQKSKSSDGSYLDLELTVDDGQPFNRRKIWDKVGDPFDPANSEAYRQMGMMAITRMLEAGKGAGPHNPAGYNLPEYSLLDGLRVAVKVGIEKGTGGYADKNRVTEYLTPNPESKSGNKGWAQLQAGVHNADQKVGMIPAASGFAKPPQGNLFQKPQPAMSALAADGAAAEAASVAAVTSPSSWGKPAPQPTPPGATPNWLTSTPA